MRLPLIIIFAFSFSLLFAQEKYHVLHVKGSIKVKSTGKILMPKDVISSNDEISFSTPGDMAAVISSSKGRMILKPDPVKAAKGELSAYVSGIVEQASGKLSTRGILNTFLDLQNYFTGPHAFLDGMATLEINPAQIPMNDQNFFFLRYQWNGETINKKLSFNGNNLIFSEKEIFTVDGNPVSANETNDFQLYYYETEWKTSRRIGDFIPVFPDNKMLLQEVSLLIELSPGLENQEKEKEIQAYIEEMYGKIIRTDFNEWFSTHIQKTGN